MIDSQATTVQASAPFADCKTLADLYRRLIQLENVCSPLEFAQIANSDYAPNQLKDKLKSTIRLMTAGSVGLRRFKRHAIAPNVDFYSLGPGASKVLLVCFCGNANRLMLPLPVFLQFVPDDRFDVLALRDPRQALFLKGIEGVADHFSTVVDQVASFAARNGYNDVRCYGTSAGGAAAIFAALRLGASAGISIGGKHPSLLLTKANFPVGSSGEELDDAIASLPAGRSTNGPRLIAAYGQDYEPDRLGAETLASRVPNLIIAPVPGCSIHNLCDWLLAQDRLTKFLNHNLLF